MIDLDFLDKYNLTSIDRDLLNIALTHSSYSNENFGDNYERLEFLGDAVLQLIITEYYYLNTELSEGEMSKLRASYVCEAALVHYAKDIDLSSHIKTGEGQRSNVNSSIIADTFESLIGAIYLSLGLHKVSSFIYSIVIIPYIEKEISFFDDYKSVLQEMVQTTKNSLEYVLVSESGPAHDKVFTVEVRIDNIVFGVGRGKSKKDAEQQAAFSAYQKRAKNW